MFKTFSYKLQYFFHKLSASNGNGHGTHSPLTYSFIKEVLNDERNFYAFNELKSEFSKSSKAENLPQKFYELLFRMVDYYQFKNIAVLGEDALQAKAYIVAANEKTQVYLFDEKDKNQESIYQFIHNCNYDFIYISSSFLQKQNDFSLINQLVSVSRNSIIIIEKIHLIETSKKLWSEISNLKINSYSVDIFHFGIIFINSNLKHSQQFKINF